MGEITDFVELYIEDSDILEDYSNDIARDLKSSIKKEAPYFQGRLKRSIRVDTRIYKLFSIITGYWDEGVAPHGIYVLAGTKPHIIKPKNKKALSWPSMTTEYPVRIVHHPGTKPNDFLGRGLEGIMGAYS